MDIKEKLEKLSSKRNQAAMEIGQIDKEINECIRDVPRLKEGDVYITEPFQDTDKWMIVYYIIPRLDEQGSLPGCMVTNSCDGPTGIHTRLETISFVVMQDHDHGDQFNQVGFQNNWPNPTLMQWDYLLHSRRWTIETDYEHDHPRYLCNLKDTSMWKPAEKPLDGQSFLHEKLGEELMHGMNDLQIPSHFASDEVKLKVKLDVLPEIFCLRDWTINHLSRNCDGIPDEYFVGKTNWNLAVPFRWYSSADKGMFILTEEGWLDSELETYTPNDAENTSDEDMANWASHLELVKYNDDRS